MKPPKVVVYRDASLGGYVEPADRSWVLYFAPDGEATFYPRRRKGGAVYGPRLSTRDGYSANYSARKSSSGGKTQ